MIKKEKVATKTVGELIELTSQKLLTVDNPSQDYFALLDGLDRLLALQRTMGSKFRVNPDTVLTIAGNLLGILLILNFEKIGYISSKALSFVLKPKF